MKRITWFLILAVAVSGCAANLKNIRPTYTFTGSDINGVVAGKIRYKDCGNFMSGSVIKLVDNKTDKQYYAEFYFINDKPNKNGDIERNLILELPQGKYSLTTIEVNNIFLGGGRVFIRPSRAFIVKPNAITYIRTIELSPPYSLLSFSIIDEADDMRKELKSIYPNLTSAIDNMRSSE